MKNAYSNPFKTSHKPEAEDFQFISILFLLNSSFYLMFFFKDDLLNEENIIFTVLGSFTLLIFAVSLLAAVIILIISYLYIVSEKYFPRLHLKIFNFFTQKIMSARSLYIFNIIIFIIPFTFLIFYNTLLIYAMFSRSFDGINLIRDAVIIWVFNLLDFTILYYYVDAGGAKTRKKIVTKFEPDNFTFAELDYKADWKPIFFDYLFLSFNISTAFSITDNSAITPGAKACVMLQSVISLSAIIVIAARAINILTTA